TIIGHMWRLLARSRSHPITLVLGSGDGRTNEFGTSFFEVIDAVLATTDYPNWTVELASFDWPLDGSHTIHPPLKTKLKKLVESSPRGKLINLMDHYANIVYHESHQ